MHKQNGTQRDYRKMYGIEETIRRSTQLVEELTRDGIDDPTELVLHVMDRDIPAHEGYCVGSLYPHSYLSFGYYTPLRVCGNRTLALINEDNGPAVVLKYHVYDSPQNIEVRFVQAPNSVRQYYSKVESVNPHEYLVAHFLARVAPILDEFPDVHVNFFSYAARLEAQHRGSVPEEKKSIQTTCNALRDRFFTRENLLNPAKARVISILGAENRWIQSE